MNDVMGGVSAIFEHGSPPPSPNTPSAPLPWKLGVTAGTPGEPSIINTCICDKSARFEAGTGYGNWLARSRTRSRSHTWRVRECRRGPAVSLAEPRPVKTAPAILIITSNCGKRSPRHFSCLLSFWPAHFLCTRCLPLTLVRWSLSALGTPSTQEE